MIETPRLRLRVLQADDAGWLAREISNPQVQRWPTRPPHPYRMKDAEEFIDRFAADTGTWQRRLALEAAGTNG